MEDETGSVVRRLRLRAGLTQEGLAERSGVSVRTIRRIETGGRRNPQFSSLTQLADALELSPDDRHDLLGALGAATPSVAVRSVPRQLPAAPHGFAGRARELAALQEAAAGDSQAAMVTVIAGAGGIGKTWLALRWAHDHLDWFPDGQLFVNLRGFDPAADSVSPEAALHGFLTALGVPPAAIPAEPDARAALYRSTVAGRRLLVVLDNARDTAQVVPLLPGSSGSTVLITSRHRLSALLATHGARPLPLAALEPAEAREILVRHLGTARIDADPGATRALLEHCAGLPLALGIIAGQATTHPDFPLAAFAAELRVPAARLDVLDTGELPGSLRTAFSTSYRLLDAQAATTFRLVSLPPGPDITLPAAAALTGLPRAATRTALTSLEAASLVEQHRPGRYRMHDLTRLYATELAYTHDMASARRDALTRLLGHYCHVASVAADRFSPDERHRRPPIPPPAGPTVTLADAHAAVEWLDAERENLLAAVRHTDAHDRTDVAIHLSTTLYRYLDHRGHYEDGLTLHTAARDATTPHQIDHAYALCSRGYALIRLGRYDEALSDLRDALEHPRAGPLVKFAADTSLGLIHGDRGDQATALEHFTRALAASQHMDGRTTYGIALNNLGDCYRRLGRHDEALDHLQRSIAIAQEVHNSGLGGAALTSLGDLYREQGNHDEARNSYLRALERAHVFGDRGLEVEVLNRMAAIEPSPDRCLERFRQALRLAREIGLPLEQAHAHYGIARLHRALGDLTASRSHARRALDIYTALKSRDALAAEELLLDDHPHEVG